MIDEFIVNRWLNKLEDPVTHVWNMIFGDPNVNVYFGAFSRERIKERLKLEVTSAELEKQRRDVISDITMRGQVGFFERMGVDMSPRISTASLEGKKRDYHDKLEEISKTVIIPSKGTLEKICNELKENKKNQRFKQITQRAEKLLKMSTECENEIKQLHEIVINFDPYEKERAAREKAEKERLNKEKKEKAELAEINRRYEQKIRNNPNDLNNYKTRAKEYSNKGYHDLAITDYTVVIEINPEDKEAYQGRGTSYIEKHNYSGALEDLTKTIKIDSNDADIFALRGMAYSKTSEYNKAIADFEKAIRLNPKCKNAYLGKGAMYGVKGDYEKSVASYRGALLVDPSDSVTISLLENARNALKEQQRVRKENTRKTIRKILSLVAPVLAVVSLLLILVLITMGNGHHAQEYAPLLISIIPLLVIFSSKSTKTKKIIFIVLDAAFFILFFSKIAVNININFYLVMAVITNLASVTITMIFPKNNW